MNLESVQLGDQLIWHGRHPADSKVVRVDRTTKTQIIAGNNRFRKSDGYTVGNRGIWNNVTVTIPKEGEIEKIQEARLHQQLIYDINGACQIGRLRTMSLEKLQQLNALLETL